jgi:hypothetical protein
MHADGISDTIDVYNWVFRHDKHIQTKHIKTVFHSFSLYKNDSVFMIFNDKAAYSPYRMHSDDLKSKYRSIQVQNKQF